MLIPLIIDQFTDFGVYWLITENRTLYKGHFTTVRKQEPEQNLFF